MLHKKILSLLALVLVFGCVTKPKKIDLTEPPVAEPNASLDGMAEIVVYRRGDTVWSVSYPVLIDDQLIGSLYIKDYIHKRVAPGRVKVVAKAEADSEAYFPVEANHTYFLRAKMKAGWWSARVQLKIIEPEEGKEAIVGLGDKTGVMDDDPPESPEP